MNVDNTVNETFTSSEITRSNIWNMNKRTAQTNPRNALSTEKHLDRKQQQ